MVRVSERFLLLPTWTLPKASALGLGDKVPVVTPVPESGMLRFELLPFEVTLTLPLTLPLAAGAKVTVNDVLWPALKVMGKVSPDKL